MFLQEIPSQAVPAQEADGRGRVKVILVLHGLLGLGLDVEGAGEADGACIVHRHVHQPGDVLLLKLHVGIQQRLIALPAAPEGVAGAAQFDGALNGLFQLCRRVAVHIHRV